MLKYLNFIRQFGHILFGNLADFCSVVWLNSDIIRNLIFQASERHNDYTVFAAVCVVADTY